MDLSVSLPDEQARYVESEISSGRFASSSDVVREALRLMESRKRSEGDDLALLQKSWQAGVDSGDAGEVDFTALKAEARISKAAAAS